jgi:hypothetical protein
VDVGREDERVLDDHLHHRLGLRLDLNSQKVFVKGNRAEVGCFTWITICAI